MHAWKLFARESGGPESDLMTIFQNGMGYLTSLLIHTSLVKEDFIKKLVCGSVHQEIIINAT